MAEDGDGSQAITQYGSFSSVNRHSQDGYSAATLTSLAFDDDGVLSAVYNNGQVKNVAQIAIAKFDNNEGLYKKGKNLFKESYSSGQATMGKPNEGGRGDILSKSLELSNVDIAHEFVGLMTSQRNFSANAKAVQTADQMLQEVLNIKMKGKGGFNHNYQALKILTVLEKKYFDFDGLNLTFETLDGILKHNGPITSVLPSYIQSFINFFGGEKKSQGSFEAQIAAICDDIAYNNNDIDDGLYAGLFEIEELNELEIIKDAFKKINLKKSKEYRRIKYELIRKLINIMVDDLIRNTKQNIQNFKIKNCYQILELDKPLVIFGDEMKNKEKNLKVFLKNKMYNHPKVKTMNFKAKKIVSDLFDLYIDEPYLLPTSWRNFKNENEKYVNVSDYISGMTDNYAINIHKKYFDLYSH